MRKRSRRVDEKEVARLIDAALRDHNVDPVPDEICKIGPLAVSRLCEIIEDPKSLTEHLCGDHLPPVVADALTMLSQIAPKATLAYKHLAEHPDKVVSMAASLAIARSLDSRAADVIGRAIMSTDEEERSQMLSMIKGEVEYYERQPEPGFANAIQPFLMADMRRGDGITSSAELFCRLSPKEALEFLCSEENARLDFPGFSHGVEALADLQIDAPVHVILPLFEELSQRPEFESTDAVTLRSLACLLAAQRNPRVKEWIDEVLAKGIDLNVKPLDWNEGSFNWSPTRKFSAAAAAFLRYQGIKYDIVFTVDRRELDLLTEPQKTVAAVVAFMWAANGGGFVDVYSDSAREFLDEIAPALERIGAMEHLAILRRANATWGRLNPDKNFREFLKAEALPTEAQKKKFYELSRLLYLADDLQSIRSLAAIYAARNAEHFLHFNPSDPLGFLAIYEQ